MVGKRREVERGKAAELMEYLQVEITNDSSQETFPELAGEEKTGQLGALPFTFLWEQKRVPSSVIWLGGVF